MLYYAVDVPREIAELDQTTDPLVKSYLEDLKQRKSKLRDDFQQRITDECSKTIFLQNLSPKWYGSYKVRALVSPDMAKA